MNKPFEFWAVILGMMVWFFVRIPTTETTSARAAKTFASAALGFGLSHSAASYLHVDDVLGAVLVMAFGMLFLDALTALFSDKKTMNAFLRKRLGVDDEDK